MTEHPDPPLDSVVADDNVDHPRNLVLLFDGTANEIDPEVGGTNVVRLYRALAENEGSRQIAFYDPGVGTFGSTDRSSRMSRKTGLVLDRAFGRGIRSNVADGYRWLMHHYTEGDQIFLFGFSRGAYTARALAALLQGFGLLNADRENLVDYAVKYFWKGSNRESPYFAVANRFKIYFSQPVEIHFMGLWDTVSAIGWARRRFSLPWTDALTNVENGWHAIAIDERRSAYVPDLWAAQSDAAVDSDFRQVWFAGVHSDVGGTYEDHRLADIALQWMVQGAEHHGLLVDNSRTPRIEADHTSGKVHANLLPFWWLAGFTRRTIGPGSRIHQSVADKLQVEASCRPPNLNAGAMEIEPTSAVDETATGDRA